MKRCEYCGNNPVPHQLLKTNERLSLLMEPFDRLAAKLKLRKLFDPAFTRLLPPLVSGLTTIGVIRQNDDIARANTSRSKVIWQEARKRGIPMQQLFVFGKPTDFFKATVQGKPFFFESLPIPPWHYTDANQWLDDKVKLKEKLLEHRIPAARGGGFTEWKDMLRIFRMLHKPVIIKPALGSRGRHTTTHIYTEAQLKQAFRAAKQIAERLVMEEHLVGSVYRGTIVNGKLLGVLRGDPPRVTGDGKHTISELVAIKNRTKPAEVKEVVITDYIKQFLARNGYTPDTVIAKGVTIDLMEKIGIGYGGYKAEEIEITHPKTKQILEEAGRLVGFPVMGFDFIIQDITRDPDEQAWGIIECNSLPFIDLHHFPLEGKPINVAAAVWDLWQK